MATTPAARLQDDRERGAALATFVATIMGANDCATKADTLGEKVFWRMVRDEARKRYEALGGTIDFAPVEGAAVVLTLPHPPHIEFQARDIELMRACVAAHDAKSLEERNPNDDTKTRRYLIELTAVQSIRLATHLDPSTAKLTGDTEGPLSSMEITEIVKALRSSRGVAP